MRRLSAIVICLLTMAAVVALVCGAQKRRDPVYQGKRLSGWLKDLRAPSRPTAHQAQEVFGQMDTNTIELIREMLHTSDFSIQTNLANLLSRQNLVKFNFVPARERRIRAALACVLLGPKAATAIPDLLTFSQEDLFCRNLAECALGRMGETGVAGLSLALANPDYDLRRTAAGALMRIGPSAHAAVPALIGCLREDKYVGMRATAAQALGRIGLVTPEVVQALGASLADESTEVRWEAALALEGFGPPVLAWLQPMVRDTNPILRAGAVKTLQAIARNQEKAQATRAARQLPSG